MLLKLNQKRAGFTLVEIMIVVAIIALLAAIAVPNFLRARKRSQATMILEDMRVIDAAIDQYAIDNNKSTGDTVVWTDVQPYLKAGSVLYNSNGNDLLGNPFIGLTGPVTFTVDTPSVDPGSSACLAVNPTTYAKLSDVAPVSFWSPYVPPVDQ
jgi:prepilin-type N-terminal cleavage/methylation domain-containing protein